MKSDPMIRLLLFIIAACLAVLAFREPAARAATILNCQGELTAKAYGGTLASIGGYRFEMTCDP